MNELDSLVASAQALFAQSATPADLENAKAQFLGKSGRITELMKGLSTLSVEEKKSRGAVINQAKQAIEAALNQRRQALADAELQAQLKAEALDVTLPGRADAAGGLVKGTAPGRDQGRLWRAGMGGAGAVYRGAGWSEVRYACSESTLSGFSKTRRKRSYRDPKQNSASSFVRNMVWEEKSGPQVVDTTCMITITQK